MAPLQVVYEDFSACCDEFVEGVSYLRDRVMPKAVNRFQQAYESVDRADVYHNKYASYCGLARVLSGDGSGLEMCRQAIGNELYDGDVYLNLARAEWFYENRKATVIALKKGLQVDNRHPGLRLMREQLGVRHRSALPFLPRSHPLNHTLGKLLRHS
ncbi:hypothetical protein MNBD_GAMMA10-2004 [hydrothermal vent metagenome]|uniref:Uncharacterized protein n=1 Tax=hydrothermal vent metagenome TaxID=652676 RepID=A0A3B0XYK4_9ZZZZ